MSHVMWADPRLEKYLIAVVLELDTGPVTKLLSALLANLHKLLDDAALALAGVLHDDVRVLPTRGVQDVGLLPAGRQSQLVEVNQPVAEELSEADQG